MRLDSALATRRRARGRSCGFWTVEQCRSDSRKHRPSAHTIPYPCAASMRACPSDGRSCGFWTVSLRTCRRAAALAAGLCSACSCHQAPVARLASVFPLVCGRSYAGVLHSSFAPLPHSLNAPRVSESLVSALPKRPHLCTRCVSGPGRGRACRATAAGLPAAPQGEANEVGLTTWPPGRAQVHLSCRSP